MVADAKNKRMMREGPKVAEMLAIMAKGRNPHAVLSIVLCSLESVRAPSLREAIVFLENFTQPIMRQGDYLVILNASHCFSSDHGIDHSFFGGLHCGGKNFFEQIVGQHF